MRLNGCRAACFGLFVGAGLVLTSPGASAQVFKCEANGAVVYQQTPCEGGSGRQINAVPNSMDKTAPDRRPPAVRPTASGLSGTFDQVARAQRNGMWEHGEVGRPERGYFCVTDDQKVDPRRSLPPAFGGNCKVPKDTFGSGRFELQVQCVLGTPGTKDFGSVLMSMTGTASPQEMSIRIVPSASGNHPRLEQLATFVRTERTEQWRWLRPCNADEKPGPQHVHPKDAVRPVAAESKEISRRVPPPGRRPDHQMGVAEVRMYQLGDASFVEGLGVYRAANGASQIDVRVRKSTRPLVLVLSSNDPVRWSLSLEAGAEISAILVSGSAGQTVAGVLAKPVVDIGRVNAYEKTQLEPLQQRVTEKIGRPIDKFQNQREAQSFTVGGLSDSSVEKDTYGLGDHPFVEVLDAHGVPAMTAGQINIVEVRVQPSTRPLVLILDSNEAVQWKLGPESGANLKAILVAGSSGQSVTGAGSVKVVQLGVSRPSIGDMQKRQQELEQKIGRRIDRFQAKMLGDKARIFTAGGT